MLKRGLLILTFFTLFTGYIFSQDPQFSQFYSNPLYLAPSFCGAAEGNRINLAARDQWFTLPATFRSFTFSYDYFFSNYNSGVGVMLLKDIQGSGALGTTELSLMYSYTFYINPLWLVRPGLKFSYIENTLDFNKLEFYDQIIHDNPEFTTNNVPFSEFARDVDVGTSVLVYSEKIWFGSMLDHVLQPNISLYGDKTILPMRFTAFGGYQFIRRGRLLKPQDETMSFTFLLKHQNTQTQLDVGTYWHKNPLVFGIWYRGIPPFNSQRGDAVVFLIGYKTRYFNIGYSYDFTISNLIKHAVGSHEVSMSVKFTIPRRKKLGEVPCPEF